jgi:hypothetical protein
MKGPAERSGFLLPSLSRYAIVSVRNYLDAQWSHPRARLSRKTNLPFRCRTRPELELFASDKVSSEAP